LEDYVNSNRFPLILALGITVAAPSSAQNVKQAISDLGTIDWSEHVIRVGGRSVEDSTAALSIRRARAIEDAKRDAYEKLVQITKEITINGDLLAAEMLQDNEELSRSLASVTRHFTVEEIKRLPPDGIEVSISFDMLGGLSDILMRKEPDTGILIVPPGPLCPLCGRLWPEGKPAPAGINLVTPGDTTDTAFSGLIVDARGFRLEPALAPRIFDQDGYEVYGTRFANRENGVEVGLVVYASNVEHLTKLERVGENPLHVRAIAVGGEYAADLVVANGDARIIHAAASGINFLAECRVIIIVD
jgi:hypothetical protein